MSQPFTPGSQSIAASASASVLPVNIQSWFPLGLPGLISLLSKGLSRVFSSTTVQKHQFSRCSAFFMVQLSYLSMTSGQTIDLTIQTFVGKVMSLLFNMLSRFVIAFLPRSKCLLISWLQSVTIHSYFGAQENKVCHYFNNFYSLLLFSNCIRRGILSLSFLKCLGFYSCFTFCCDRWIEKLVELFTRLQTIELPNNIMGFPGGSVLKNPPAVAEGVGLILDQEDPLEKEMATHSSILAWEIPWTEEPGGLQSMGSQKSRIVLFN